MVRRHARDRAVCLAQSGPEIAAARPGAGAAGSPSIAGPESNGRNIRRYWPRAVDSTLEGDLDLRGFLGVSDDVRRGYERIAVVMRVEADADAATLDELVAAAQKHSPVYDIVTNGVPVSVRRGP